MSMGIIAISSRRSRQPGLMQMHRLIFLPNEVLGVNVIVTSALQFILVGPLCTATLTWLSQTSCLGLAAENFESKVLVT